MSRWLEINPQAPAPPALAELRDYLAAGGVAALPTDTLYGLAANARRAGAVARVFALKGRDFSKPLPLVVRDLEQAAEVAAHLPPLFHRLAQDFWPGPLTLIVAAAPGLPPALTAGTGTVGMRQPSLPLLAALLRLTGFPLTATSANRSGGTECRSAAAVEAQLGDSLDLIVDGGLSPLAQPSTMVDLTAAVPRIVRAGAIPADALTPYWEQ